MLWAPSVAGQSYWAVLWIGAGCSGDRGREALEVGRQSVHVWVRRYRREGRPGLVPVMAGVA